MIKNHKTIDNHNMSIIDVFNKYESIKKTEIEFNWIDYIRANHDLRLKSEIEAINHYMTIGKIQNRPLKISY